MNKLSIIIVNYNVSYFLEQALLSVQNAISNIKTEVFVVDNNSVDGTAAIVNKYIDNGHTIQYYKNAENIGADRNIAACFLKARGKPNEGAEFIIELPFIHFE